MLDAWNTLLHQYGSLCLDRDAELAAGTGFSFIWQTLPLNATRAVGPCARRAHARPEVAVLRALLGGRPIWSSAPRVPEVSAKDQNWKTEPCLLPEQLAGGYHRLTPGNERLWRNPYSPMSLLLRFGVVFWLATAETKTNRNWQSEGFERSNVRGLRCPRARGRHRDGWCRSLFMPAQL